MRFGLLADPTTGEPVGPITERAPELFAPRHVGDLSTPIGVTDQLLLSGDAAYPVVDGVPVMLDPERLEKAPRDVEIDGTIFEESYQESALYSALAEEVLGANARGSIELARVFETAVPETFPEPASDWSGGGSTAAAYGAAMRHLAPVTNALVLQIGGVGTHALKMVHAGAEHAVVVSPVVSEMVEGKALAAHFDMTDRVTFVAGVAEQLPLMSGVFDRVYSGSSMHHTDTSLSFPEIARILRPETGRWASVDVWESTFHNLGTSLFGKCHGNPYCHPLSAERIHPAIGTFPNLQVSHHGGAVRYPLAVLERVGFRPSASMAVRLAAIDERIPMGPLETRLKSLVCLRGHA